MNAYNLAMLLIIFNLAFCFLAATNIFPAEAQLVEGKEVTQSDLGSTAGQILNIFKGVGIGGLLGSLAGLVGAIATRSWAPVAVGLFSGIFWGSVYDTSRIISKFSQLLGSSFLPLMFSIIAGFIFAATIIQMLAGGMKTYE